MKAVATLLVMTTLLSMNALAQQDPGSLRVTNVNPAESASASVSSDSKAAKKSSPQTGKSTTVGWLSSFEFWMSFSVLLFGMLTFAIEIMVVRLIRFEPEQAIKLFAVTLLVISTLFVVTAGFDSLQIAPAMGLFGTIAGYMLGRNGGKHEEHGK